MNKFFAQIHNMIWGIPMLILILGVGFRISYGTKIVQFRFLPSAFRKLFSGSQKEGCGKNDASAYEALCTALAATVGTGNLAGVAGAISIGGPGAVFWMWICAFLGMVIKYAEATLAVRYRQSIGDEYFSGPMYIIRHGLGKRFSWLAYLYAGLCVVAAFGVGNATQMNTVVSSINQLMSSFGVSLPSAALFAFGVILAGFVLLLLLGGATRIRRFVSGLVPFASGLYVLLALGILVLRFSQIPQAFASIFSGAFSPSAVTGGIVGSVFQVMRVGASRGIFTNEAGMGTAAIAHGVAKVAHPCEQGLMGIMEVFIDTVVICTLTALVILCSGVPVAYGIDQGVVLTLQAFTSVYGSWSQILLSICLCCFAFATIVGWSYYGGRCAQFLFGKFAWTWFSLVQAAVSLVSVFLGTGVIWTLSEIFNGLLSIPNLIALLILCPEVIRLTQDYRYQYGTKAAVGGTNENFYQCKPVRTFSHEKVSPHGCQRQK